MKISSEKRKKKKISEKINIIIENFNPDSKLKEFKPIKLNSSE